jgi:hypothetical protein
VQVGAYVDNTGTVGDGSQDPRGEVSQIVGRCLPQSGLAGATAHLVARRAFDNEVIVIICGQSRHARDYKSEGSGRIGTTSVAEIGRPAWLIARHVS